MVLANRDFKKGDKVVVVRVCSHGDWKTATLHPEKWQTLIQGREGIFQKWFSNLYGDFARVDFDGVLYDIEPINILPKFFYSHNFWIYRSAKPINILPSAQT